MPAVVCLLVLLVTAVAADKKGDNDDEVCKRCFADNCTPSLKGIPKDEFKVAEDCNALSNAMSKFITDNDTLYKILSSRSESQRDKIVDQYVKKGVNLVINLNCQTSGRFSELMTAMVTPLWTFYSRKLGGAIYDGNRLVMGEILACLTPCLIRQVSNEHQKMYGRNLYDDLNQYKMKDVVRMSNSEFVGVVQSLARGDRDESTDVDRDKAVQDAKRLKDAGVGRMGTDETVFIEVFTKPSMPQLAETLRQYDELRTKDGDFVSLEQDIYSEFSTTSLRQVFMNIARNALNQPLYFAQEIEKLMKVLVLKSEDEEKLIRIIRGRADIDMEEIKAAYEKEYGKPLADRVQNAFFLGGPFPRALVAIINGKG